MDKLGVSTKMVQELERLGPWDRPAPAHGVQADPSPGPSLLAGGAVSLFTHSLIHSFIFSFS